jgi:hypothetical protein
VVIAHSHGGNIMAGAFAYLDSQISDLRVCYLATPFLELFLREVGRFERLIIAAAATFVIFIASFIPFAIAFSQIHKYLYGSVGENNDWSISILVFLSVMAGRGVYHWAASTRSQTRNEKLMQATRSISHDQSHGSSLVLRAIDDEASLALAFGTIANLLSTRLLFALTLFLLATTAFDAAFSTFGDYKYSDVYFDIGAISAAVLLILIVASLLALVSRGVFGRELLYFPPGIQINVQSVPDWMRSAEIRTLLREGGGSFLALRHGIYSHPNASDVVADWIVLHTPRTLDV